MHFFGTKNTPFIDELLLETTLRGYVKKANAIAKRQDAIAKFEVGSYKDINELKDIKWSPKYFGGAIEFLCENFFIQYGERFGVYDFESVGDFDSNEIDSGVDHRGKNNLAKKLGGMRECHPGSDVYIQTKGTANSAKKFMTNDGSRIMNFYGNAQGQALMRGQAYQARYILFTTGSGLHYRLEQSTFGMIEVINFKVISNHIDGRTVFFDNIRERVGLPKVWLAKHPMDIDAQKNALSLTESIDISSWEYYIDSIKERDTDDCSAEDQPS